MMPDGKFHRAQVALCYSRMTDTEATVRWRYFSIIHFYFSSERCNCCSMQKKCKTGSSTLISAETIKINILFSGNSEYLNEQFGIFVHITA